MNPEKKISLITAIDFSLSHENPSRHDQHVERRERKEPAAAVVSFPWKKKQKKTHDITIQRETSSETMKNSELPWLTIYIKQPETSLAAEDRHRARRDRDVTTLVHNGTHHE